MPMTPFMGVRISWLMLARNWLLAMLAVCDSKAISLAQPMAFSSSLFTCANSARVLRRVSSAIF